MGTKEGSLDWDISGTGLVLSSVENLFLISVGGLVGDDWNISGLGGDNVTVLGVVLGVVSGLFFHSVLSLMLDSVVSIEDSVVSGLFISSVEDSVLVGVSGLWLISVLGLRVGSLEDFDLSSVSVLFLVSVVDLVVGLVGGEWDVIVVGLSVVSVDKSWFPGESSIVIGSVLDFIGSGGSDFLLWSVLDLSLREFSGVWNLSGSDFGLSLGLDGVLDLFVKDFDVTEMCVLDFVNDWFPLDGGCGTDKGNCEASHDNLNLDVKLTAAE